MVPLANNLIFYSKQNNPLRYATAARNMQNLEELGAVPVVIKLLKCARYLCNDIAGIKKVKPLLACSSSISKQTDLMTIRREKKAK
jgi:hypothetical protein